MATIEEDKRWREPKLASLGPLLEQPQPPPPTSKPTHHPTTPSPNHPQCNPLPPIHPTPHRALKPRGGGLGNPIRFCLKTNYLLSCTLKEAAAAQAEPEGSIYSFTLIVNRQINNLNLWSHSPTNALSSAIYTWSAFYFHRTQRRRGWFFKCAYNTPSMRAPSILLRLFSLWQSTVKQMKSSDPGR